MKKEAHTLFMRIPIEMVDPVRVERRRAAFDAMDRITFGAVLAKRDAWARIAGCMREEAGSVVGSVIV